MTRNCRHWSTTSAPCRLELGPSRLLAAALIALGLLAAGATLLSEMPLPAALPLATVALVHAAWRARRELRRGVRRIVVPHSALPATLDGTDMAALEVHWRGPLATLAWRDPEGRRRRLHGWPDTLRRPARRELRLALAARGPARVAPSVAP
jgi:toxin CptA